MGAIPSARDFLTLSHNRSALVVSYSVEVSLGRLSVTFYAHRSPIRYSYKTNQYGLAIDTIVGFNLVLPNGTVTYVTQSTHPDLFFGLKGGFNNFVSLFFSLITSPPGLTYRVPGNRDGFYDDRVPSNRSMGTDNLLCRCSPVQC